MRAVIQRVKQASVTVDNTVIAEINMGLLVLIGITKDDTAADRAYLTNKLVKLRIFPDEQGIMNRSVQDVGGEILLVSQFTLYGDCSKGNRPSFGLAMAPEQAKVFYEQFVQEVRFAYSKISSGQFQADMDVSLINWGPVTIILDSKRSK